MRQAVVCLVFIFLYGCSNFQYIQPTSGDRARVRFVSNTAVVPTVLRVYGGEDCSGSEQDWMRLRDSTGWFVPISRLGMPLGNFTFEDFAFQEVYVNAEKPLTAILWSSNQTQSANDYTCGIPISVNFQKNKDYEVMYNLDGKSCSVNITEIAKGNNNAGYVRYRVARFESNRDISAGCAKRLKEFQFEIPTDKPKKVVPANVIQ